MAKLGFSKRFSCHFHVLPISDNLLHEIAINNHHSHANNEPDGVDALLFINRKYCEKKLTLNEYKILSETVGLLRKQYKKIG